MFWLALVGLLILLCFGFVLLFGAPYLPTLTPQVETALELINLKPGQILLELGCGDGKVLIAAAQTGLHVVGYELNPILALLCWLRTRRFKKQVKIVWGNFFTQQWPPADGIFIFLQTRFMIKLDKKIQQDITTPLKLVSFAYALPDRQPVKQKNGVLLYSYPVVPSKHEQA